MATKLQKLFVSTICLLLACNICAQEDDGRSYNTYAGRKPRHYLGISLSGGEANNLGKTDTLIGTIKHLGGAGAGFGLHYERQQCSWIVGFSVEAQYQYLRDRLNHFTDQPSQDSARIYNIIDPLWPDAFTDEYSYTYEHSHYIERGHYGSGAFSIYGGREITEDIYLLLGVKVTVSLQSWYHVLDSMSTSASNIVTQEDLKDMGAFNDDELHDYGVFGKEEYTYHNKYRDYVRIAPFVELGYNIPLRANKTKMRVGIYGTYGFRLGESDKKDLIDYEQVKRTWGRVGYDMEDEKGNIIKGVQSTQMLQETIKWNPVTQSKWYKSLPHNLEVGAKLTILFDVTTEKKVCNCSRF